jgi:trans-aconitate 2-methyltransferase
VRGDPEESGYTFGDDDAAERRLELVAEAYRATSESFVGDRVPRRVGSVVDLGCGPGWSTELLARASRPHRLVGIDASASFVGRARRRVAGADFVVHDASSTPLPSSPHDVIYARLLLAHLRDPVGVVRRWQGELAPGGVVLVEDLEDVVAPPGPLADYEALSAGMVRSGGGPMYAGRSLAHLGGRCVEVTVPARLAARIYRFNVDRWLAEGTTPWEQGRLRRLGDELDDLSGSASGSVSWTVRQIALPAA